MNTKKIADEVRRRGLMEPRQTNIYKEKHYPEKVVKAITTLSEGELSKLILAGNFPRPCVSATTSRSSLYWEKVEVDEWIDECEDFVMQRLANKKSPQQLLDRHDEALSESDYKQLIGSLGREMITLQEIQDQSIMVKSGVYFLSYKGELIYVGQAVNIYKRLSSHSVRFDAFTYIECDKSELNQLESFYIHWFRPKMNATYPDGSKTAPIPYREIVKDAKKAA